MCRRQQTAVVRPADLHERIHALGETLTLALTLANPMQCVALNCAKLDDPSQVGGLRHQ